MANPSKRKGTAWESDVGRFLREDGHDDARRVVQMGRLDIADLHVGPVAIEAKNVRTIDLASFVDQAEREAINAGLPYGVAVIKRRGRGVAAGHVATSLRTFSRMLRDLRASTREAERLRAEIAALRAVIKT